MDVLTKEKRRRNMQNIHSRDTTIELLLRKALWHKGVRFRVHDKRIIGKPDISIKKYKLAVFCDGDFWHGNCSGRKVGTNTQYWEQKIQRNRERDLEQTIMLRDAGWTVLRYWGTDIKNNPDSIADDIIKVIDNIKQRIVRRRRMQTQFSKNGLFA